MNMRPSKTSKAIADITPYSQVSQAPRDLEEVSFIKEYQSDVETTNTHTQKRIYPLIDIVTPQPKAFFAYLQMPNKKAKATRKKSASSSRLSRSKKGVK